MNLDLLTAIKQALDRSCPDRLFIEHVKNRFDRPDNNMERDPAVLPSLDECPVERAQKQVLATPAYKRFLDLCEIVVVIQGDAGVM